ncbi:hypothetical protein H5410_057741 [Solanum commersonii]|uniref:Uncharacterized protein n=1 Tax=Solanum commersonii TaxID=4109 RepID=A0A9J5WQW3_SOLCO|nr:hypothetical protein H5410_057741 [Solanum commersonii]
MCGHTQRDMIRNEVWGKVEMDQTNLRWFVHVNRRCEDGGVGDWKVWKLRIKLKANGRLEVWRQILESKGLKLRRIEIEYLECKFNVITHEVDVELQIDTQVISKKNSSSGADEMDAYFQCLINCVVWGLVLADQEFTYLEDKSSENENVAMDERKHLRQDRSDLRGGQNEKGEIETVRACEEEIHRCPVRRAVESINCHLAWSAPR